LQIQIIILNGFLVLNPCHEFFTMITISKNSINAKQQAASEEEYNGTHFVNHRCHGK